MSELRIGLASIPVEENALSCNFKTVDGVLEENANDDIDPFVFGEAVLTGLDTENGGFGGAANTSEVLWKANRLAKAKPDDETAEVFGCLAYDCSGDRLIETSKKVGESTFHTIDVELQKAHRKWGGFQDRKRYLNSVCHPSK